MMVMAVGLVGGAVRLCGRLTTDRTFRFKDFKSRKTITVGAQGREYSLGLVGSCG